MLRKLDTVILFWFYLAIFTIPIMRYKCIILGGKTMYNNKKDKEKDTKYRKVEAMWKRGCSVDEIVRSVKLSRMDVLDVTQKIFALDMKRA